MQRRAAIIALCLTAAFSGAAARISAQKKAAIPETDVQDWNEVQLTIPFSKKVDMFLDGIVRVSLTAARPVDERGAFGFTYKVSKYLTLNEMYFHRKARPSHGPSETEDRLTLGATIRVPIGKFTLSDRNGFERRWRKPQVDAFRYRNRAQLEHPFRVAKLKFSLFVSDEVFYDWSFRAWVRNRFAVGANHVFSKHLNVDLYYLRQNDGRARPGDINVIGTTWRIRL